MVNDNGIITVSLSAYFLRASFNASSSTYTGINKFNFRPLKVDLYYVITVSISSILL